MEATALHPNAYVPLVWRCKGRRAAALAATAAARWRASKSATMGQVGSNCIHLTVRSSSPTYTKGAHAIRGYKTLGTKHIRGYKSLGTNRQARGQAVSHTLKAQLGEEPGVLALLVLFGEHLAANQVRWEDVARGGGKKLRHSKSKRVFGFE